MGNTSWVIPNSDPEKPSLILSGNFVALDAIGMVTGFSLQVGGIIVAQSEGTFALELETIRNHVNGGQFGLLAAYRADAGRGLSPTQFLSASNDALAGTPNNNSVFGGGGADALAGNGGNDTLVGGGGRRQSLRRRGRRQLRPRGGRHRHGGGDRGRRRRRQGGLQRLEFASLRDLPRRRDDRLRRLRHDAAGQRLQRRRGQRRRRRGARHPVGANDERRRRFLGEGSPELVRRRPLRSSAQAAPTSSKLRRPGQRCRATRATTSSSAEEGPTRWSAGSATTS